MSILREDVNKDYDEKLMCLLTKKKKKLTALILTERP